MNNNIKLLIFLIPITLIIIYLIICKNYQKFSNSDKKIGIVISCFNRPDYLIRTLKSISKSNLSNTILCLIDDHSSDSKNWDIIQKFKIKDSSCEVIKIRNEENLGIRYSLKKGWDLLYPKCDYLCNIDSDTIVKKDWLNKLKNTESIARKKLNAKHYIISGFNCNKSCGHKIIKDYGNFYLKNTIGGINMFFNKNVYKKFILNIMSKGDKIYGWDWEVCYEAPNQNCKIIVTKPSVIQHIGIEGLYSSKKSYNIAEDF